MKKASTSFIFIYLIILASCKDEVLFKRIIKQYANTSDSVNTGNNNLIHSAYFNNGNYVAEFTYNDKLVLKNVSGHLKNRRYGHYFEFDDYGTLFDYNFKTGNSQYTYQVVYNMDSAKYIEIGSPFVDYWKVQIQDNKKYNIGCIFSSFPRKSLDISYSFDGKYFNTAILKESKLLPYAKEIEIAAPNGSKKIYLKLEAGELIYNWIGIKENRTSVDTLYLD